MPSLENDVLRAIGALRRRESVDVVGARGTGRTHLLRTVRDELAGMRWRVSEVRGVRDLRDTPMAALALAGITASSPAEAVVQLAERLGTQRSVIVVDDADALDPHSRAVLTLARERTGAPILAAYAAGVAVAGEPRLRDVVRITTAPLSMGDLRGALRACTGLDLDAPTLAAVWTLTGGVMGLAVALVAEGARAGRCVTHEGLTAIDGPLWPGQLSALIAGELAELSGDEHDALEFIARFGPIPLDTAGRILPTAALRTLEQCGHVRMTDREGEPVFSASRGPLLEHFAHSPLRGGFLLYATERLAALVGECPAAAHTLIDGPDLAPRVRLAIAEDAWLRTPGARTGAVYAARLVAVGEPEAALSIVDSASGFPALEAVAWYLGRVRVEVLCALGRPMEAVRTLRAAAAAEHPAGALLLARAVALECRARGSASATDLPHVDDVVDVSVRAEMVRAQAFLDLAAGRLCAVESVLPTLLEDFPDDDGVHQIAVLLDVAGGRIDSALRIALRRMHRARRRSAHDRVHDFVHLAVLAALIGGRKDLLSELISELEQTPHSSMHARSVRGAIAALTLPACGPDVASLRTVPLPDRGGLPGMGEDWWQAAGLRQADRSEESAAVLHALGDRLWAEGARLTATFAYLTAAGRTAAPEVMAALEDRVALIDGEGVALLREGILAIRRREHPRAKAALVRIERLNMVPRAIDGWELLARQAEAAGDRTAAAQYRAEVARLEAELGGPEPMGESMTARERQIVRMVVAGMTHVEIARELVLSVRTVESHVHRALRKSGPGTRGILAATARRAPTDAGEARRPRANATA